MTPVANSFIEAKRAAEGPITMTPALKPWVAALLVQREGLKLLQVSGEKVLAGNLTKTKVVDD